MASRYAGGCDGRTVRWRDHQARRRAMIVSATVVVIDEFGPDLSTERLAAAAGLHRMLQNGYRVDAGKETLTSTNRLEVTVTKVQGQWLLSAVTNVPLL